jgi:phosphoglycerate dehydrogenase-like enzyme
VLITSPSAAGEAVPARLRALGWAVRHAHVTGSTSEDEVIANLEGVDGVVAHIEPFTRRVLAARPGLRVISRVGVGYDAVDVDAATELGVAVCTSVGSNHESVADFAVMLMLGMARRFKECYEAVVPRGGWARPVGVEFFGKTVGVIGTGLIGREVIKRVRGFDCPVLAHDVVEHPHVVATPGARYVALDTLLAGADFVTLHAPLIASTHHLIGARELGLMQPHAFLVNTARGPLIDEQALFHALQARQIAGAGLDVFEREPLAGDSPLRTLDNVLLTPHAAGAAHETLERSAAMATDNLVRVLQGEPPLSCVNPAALSHARG